VIFRSMLFAPANHRRHASKALAGQADAAILDLEDAVAEDEKAAARQAVHLQRVGLAHRRSVTGAPVSPAAACAERVSRVAPPRFVSVRRVGWPAAGALSAILSSLVPRLLVTTAATAFLDKLVGPDRRVVGLDEWLAAPIAALVRAIGWSGIFGVQFILAEGRAYAIDFNPRIYGSLALAIASGLNLPAIWVDLLLGREVNPGAYRTGVRYRVEENDYRALLRTFRRGERAQALRGALPRRGTVHGVFAADDPMPLLATLEKGGRMLASRGRPGRNADQQAR